jgi:hypothetical protein
MEEIASAFLFKKLRHEKYLTLDVMMNVERTQILEFIFYVNKYSRTFLYQNYSSI